MSEPVEQSRWARVWRVLRSPLLYWGLLFAYLLYAGCCYIPQWAGKPGISLWFAAEFGALSCVLWRLCKWRGKPCLPSCGLLWGMTALAAVYVFCCNIGAFVYLGQMHVSVLLTLGCMFILWGLLRYAALLIWLPFLLLQFVQFAAYEQYSTRLNSLVIAEALEASEDEVAAYMSAGNLLLLAVVLLGIALMLGLQVWLLRKVKGLGSYLLTGSLFLFLAFISASAVPEDELDEDALWPVHQAYVMEEAVREALYHNQQTVRIVEALPSPAEQPSSIHTLQGNEGAVLVLHIGESVRADHMSLNGYERDTTPWLRSRPDLINFPNCISAACDTCQAQIAILTNARRDIYDTTPNMQATTGSVLDLFHANGFRVYAFFGRRVGQQLKYDRVVRLLTRCAQQRFNAPKSPWTAIPQMQEVLASVPREQNLVLFVNNEGSHTPFYHFDEETAPFTPFVREFENPSAQATEVKNAYDNTIHYTDEYIRRVAEQLQGRPFLYVYISDHGEYLGHDGIWGRGALGDAKMNYHDTQGCRVGMFVFASPEFRALHPHFEQSLQRLQQHSSLCVGHEHIFHTLLGTFGISSPHYNPALDLSSDSPQPYSGPAPK